MNNIYVETIPSSCDECPCCNSDVDYGACCNLGSYGFEECYCTNKKHPNCPLKPLTDRLTEERKKVVQEIREHFKNNLLDWYEDEDNVNKELYLDAGELWKILDQIEGASDE